MNHEKYMAISLDTLLTQIYEPLSEEFSGGLTGFPYPAKFTRIEIYKAGNQSLLW